MKSSIAPAFRPLLAMVLIGLAAGCTHDYSYNEPPAQRKRIPLAPIGVASPGIGGVGGGSADTRATGTIASGEGDTPIGVDTPASAPLNAPGVAPASGVGGARPGGRY